MCVFKTERLAENGQSTVEAAVLVPMLFVSLLLLVQPGILLYDRVVMQGAAAEGCRLLATKTAALGDMQPSCEAFIRHRLSAVPPSACFHVHDGGCTWNVKLAGDEGSKTVSVGLSTEVRPLPLFDVSGALLGMVNENGNFEISVSSEMPVQPDWVFDDGEGQHPAQWIGAWLG